MLNRDRLRAHYLFTIPITVIYLVFFILPVFIGIFYSLTDWNGLSQTFNIIGLKNYADLFQDKQTYKVLGFTIKYALIYSVSVTIISLLLGILLNQKFRGRSLARAVYFFPAVMSSIIIGMIFSEIYYRALPLLGQAMDIPFLSKSIASNPKTAMIAVLIANIWQGVAIPTAIILAGLQSIDQGQYEAAAIDGANSFQRFFKITLPYIVPTLTIVSVLAVKGGLLVYEYIVAITNGGPAGSTTSIGLYVYETAFSNFRYSYSLANSTVLFVIIALFGFVYIKILGLMEARS